MSQKKKIPPQPQSEERSSVPELTAGMLQRILTRNDSIVWSAVVELIDPETKRAGQEVRFRWDFHIVSSSPAVREWLGLDRSSSDGVAWSASFVPEYLPEMDRRVRNALLGNKGGYRQEFPLRGRSGDIRWMHETVEIEPLEENRWQLAGILSDISQRKEAEDGLLQSELRFRSVWEGSHDPMRLTDAEGFMVAVNPAFCDLVAMTQDELLGRPLGVVFAGEEDRAGLEDDYRRDFREVKFPRRFDLQARLQSGRRVHLEVSLALIQGNEQWPLCLTIFRDTTRRMEREQELRRSEAFFRSIWENSRDGMRLTSLEGEILAVNDAFCRLVGLQREKLVGRPFPSSYADPGSAFEMLAGYRKRCADRDFGTRRRARVHLHSGELRELDLSLCEIEGDKDGPVFLTMMRDVTEDKQAEKRRLELERKMLDAQRLESLGVLAGGIAHDFNNLLTAILGNASLAMMRLPASSALRPFLEGIEKTSLTAADLCKQMLAYAGHGRAEFRRFSLNSLLEEMNHLLEVSVNKQIILRSKFSPGLPEVRAEPSEIQQVVMNLVINASEAIGDRSGTITLSTGLVRADRAFLEDTFLAPDLPEGDYVYLEVADTGCGMDSETKKRIFDPFFTTKFTGRGLGLAAVLGILQRHKAAFKVYSEPNRGTTFKILLAAAEPESETEGEPPPASWRSEGTILVVDDEQSVRAVAARMLERCGFTVLLAKHGGEAVDVFRRYADELDLVILDMTMPVMGGEEAFRQIRRLKPTAKVLLMSGYIEADATDRFAGKGLSGFIQKPFKWETLEAKLREIFGSGGEPGAEKQGER